MRGGYAARALAPLAGVPRAAWGCALVACLNAACWSLITPPFQAPDEGDNFAYVQQLAETGASPTLINGRMAPEQVAVEDDLHSRVTSLAPRNLTWNPKNRTIASRAQRELVERDMASDLSRVGRGVGGTATGEPPLYYAIQTIPYRLASGADLLDRLALMRLLSALLAGFTVLFVFLFLGEALPREPWAWTVGALGVAFTPLLASASAGVNPDALLFAVSAALFYALARAFRRGLTPGGAGAIGALTVVGLLTKLAFVALAPGVALGLVLLLLRARRASSGTYRLPALAGAGAALVALAYELSQRLGSGGLSTRIGAVAPHVLRPHGLAYVWQLFLPRLPGMGVDFPGFSPLRTIWFKGLIGRYNWLETVFPNYVYELALIPAGAIGLLCIKGLLDSRGALRGRLAELTVYLAIAGGTLGSLGANSYWVFPEHYAQFSEPRYLLPLLPLGGAVLALAARGAGRRLGPAAGMLIVVLSMAHDGFSQLLELARYYS